MSNTVSTHPVVTAMAVASARPCDAVAVTPGGRSTGSTATGDREGERAQCEQDRACAGEPRLTAPTAPTLRRVVLDRYPHPGGPVDEAPEPQQPQPPAEDPADEPTGVIGGLVGALSDAAEPVTSYVGSTVDSVVGGLLGG